MNVNECFCVGSSERQQSQMCLSQFAGGLTCTEALNVAVLHPCGPDRPAVVLRGSLLLYILMCCSAAIHSRPEEKEAFRKSQNQTAKCFLSPPRRLMFVVSV